MSAKTSLILAGDIGGTKSNLAVFADGDPLRPLAEGSFASSAYRDLETMVGEFLSGCGHTVRRAAFGVAGPVIEGRVKLTKLSWVIEQEAFRQALDLDRVVVVNDLVATANGIGVLPATDLICLNHGLPVEHGPMAVIAPGTGLGEAMMFWDGQRYQTQATEGGHALFSPASRQQLALAGFLFERFGAVSYDFLASGRGLPHIYEFLRQAGAYDEPAWLAQALAAASDPAPVIAEAGLDSKAATPLCRAVLQLFVEVLAVESANLALKALSTGGLYIGGGIPPRIAPIFIEAFVPAFVGQGLLREVLAAMPIHLITNPKTALLGAAHLAMTAP